MAQKVQVDEIKERFGRFIRYTVRLLPIVVIVAAITWFFLLRSPGEQTNTNGAGGADPETVSTETPNQQPETKVADNSKPAETSKEDGGAKEEGKEGKLPETGPADTAAIIAITAIAGTLFWEWRLRRAAR